MLRRLLALAVVGVALATSALAVVGVALATSALAAPEGHGVPLAALSTTAASVRTCAASVPCGVNWLTCINPNAATEYLQLFDTTATVTAGTTVPLVSLPIAASVTAYWPDLNLRFFKQAQILAATTPTGGSAPGAALNCAAGVQ